MKRNILNGIMLIGALALGSCSTQKLASNQSKQDDNVYFSNAKAGDAPVYVNAPQQTYNQQEVYDDDDYYYYNSYASRINRFGYFSPFSYYDDIYLGYSPYNSFYNPYGVYGAGFGLGLGFYNSFYSPYYAGYFGFNPYNGYGYNYFGTGYGYGYAYGGGGGYWGTVSAYGRAGAARPYRGSGAPNNTLVNRSTSAIGYNGNYPVNTAYPGRPNSSYNGQSVNSTGTRGTYTNNTYNNNNSRPTRDDAPRYQPQPVQTTSSSSNSGGYSGGGGGSSSGGGGGGARPGRP